MEHGHDRDDRRGGSRERRGRRDRRDYERERERERLLEDEAVGPFASRFQSLEEMRGQVRGLWLCIAIMRLAWDTAHSSCLYCITRSCCDRFLLLWACDALLMHAISIHTCCMCASFANNPTTISGKQTMQSPRFRMKRTTKLSDLTDTAMFVVLVPPYSPWQSWPSA